MTQDVVPPPAYLLSPEPPKRRTGLVLGLVVTGAVVALATIAALIPIALAVSGAGSTHPPAAGSTAPVPLPASTYAATLATIDDNLGTVLRSFAGAPSPESVSSFADTLDTALTERVQQLRGLVPPKDATAANKDLATALAGLAGRLELIGSSATNDHTVCAGSSALATLSTSIEADAVRAAGRELTAASPAYVFGTFLPAPTQGTNRRLANGQVLKKASGGLGEFTVENKGARDAIVTLAPDGGTSATAVVYVQGGTSATVKGIVDGRYDLFVKAGTDWDADLSEFTVDCSTDEDGSPLTFTTTRTRYSTWTVQIGLPEGGGNAAPTPVDPAAVPG